MTTMSEFVTVRPLRSFLFDGEVKTPGSMPFSLPRRDLAGFVGRQLVREVPAHPSPAAAVPQSASPAAPASPQTTAPASSAGAKRRARAKKEGE